jgi:hypothetical protein
VKTILLQVVNLSRIRARTKQRHACVRPAIRDFRPAAVTRWGGTIQLLGMSHQLSAVVSPLGIRASMRVPSPIVLPI